MKAPTRPRVAACLAAAALCAQPVSSLAAPPAAPAPSSATAAPAAPAAAPADPAADPDAESERLFYEGIDLVERGHIAEACERFEASLRLRRRGGTLLNLALCREAAGQLVSALPLFEEALDVATRNGRPDREELARRHIAEVRERLAWITLRLAPGAEVPGLVITCNGAPVPQDQWQSRIPIMPGTLVVTVSAPGRVKFDPKPILVSAGDEHTVDIPALTLTPAPAPAPPPGGRKPPDAAPPEYDLSHRWQFGAIARLDVGVDPEKPGARAVLGLTFGLGTNFEIGASALIGRDSGVEPQVTFFVLGRSAYKPLVNVGVPVFFSDGGQAGIRGALGFQWDVNRHFGAFVLIGGAYFPAAPEGRSDALFLPAAGVQGRL